MPPSHSEPSSAQAHPALLKLVSEASKLIDECVGKHSSVLSKERREGGPRPMSLSVLFIAVTFSLDPCIYTYK